ncbi:hypothetical protein ACHAXS_006061 [Conticribra weissflogii]
MAPHLCRRISLVLLFVGAASGEIGQINVATPLAQRRDNRKLKNHHNKPSDIEGKSGKSTPSQSKPSPPKPSPSKPAPKPHSGGKSGKSDGKPVKIDTHAPTVSFDNSMSMSGSRSPTVVVEETLVPTFGEYDQVVKFSSKGGKDDAAPSYGYGTKSSKNGYAATPSAPSTPHYDDPSYESKSGKVSYSDGGHEYYMASKSGKGAYQKPPTVEPPELDFSMSMSMGTIAMAPTVSSKANKPLTEWFVKTPDYHDHVASAKSGKASGEEYSMIGGKAEKEDGNVLASGKADSNSGYDNMGGKADKYDGAGMVRGKADKYEGYDNVGGKANKYEQGEGDSGNGNGSGNYGKSGKYDDGYNYNGDGNYNGSAKSSKYPPAASLVPTISPMPSTLTANTTAVPSTPSVDDDTPTTVSPTVAIVVTSAPVTPAPVAVTLAPTGPVILKVAPAPGVAPGVPTGHRTPADQIAMGGGNRPSKHGSRNGSETQSPTPYPTVFPTTYGDGTGEDVNNFDHDEEADTFVALEPFALKLYASVPEPRYDEDTVKDVTMKHLTHSFRTKNFIVDRIHLMILEKEDATKQGRNLLKRNIYELILGGIVYFKRSSNIPTADEMVQVVDESFTSERADYYIELLKESEIDIGKVIMDEAIVEPNARTEGPSESTREESGGNSTWRALTVGLCSALGGIGVLAVGTRIYYKKRKAALMNDDMDGMEKGQYVVKLKDEEEIENFPGLPGGEAHTIAMTDDRSVPSTIHHSDCDEHSSGSSSRTTSLDEIEQYDPRISPLEDPVEDTPTRYISVFTVKKDCGGKTLNEVDLRALAIAYLSKMLKKFPNTYLLPYDKTSDLQPITNIRNIPDDMSELENYVGNARVDDNTGKILFNLRVESDTPVSKMKTGRTPSKKNLAPLPAPKRALSDVAEASTKGEEGSVAKTSDDNDGMQDVSL